MLLINERLHTWYRYLPRNWNFTTQKFFSLVGNTKKNAWYSKKQESHKTNADGESHKDTAVFWSRTDQKSTLDQDGQF
jgi:hypothetical protein